MKKLIKFLCFTSFTFLFFSSQLHPAPQNNLISVKSENLANLIISINYIETEITDIQTILSSHEGLGREVVLRDRIEELSRKLSELNNNFDLLATGVQFKTAPGKLQNGFNWNQELKMLIGPVIQELQDLTLRPREIEKLRGQISFYEDHIKLANTAIGNLDKLKKFSKNSTPLGKKLGLSASAWMNRKNEWESLNNIAKMQLELKSNDQSISKSLQDIPKVFFKSHGLNMLIAFLVFLISAFLMFKCHSIIAKYSPIHAEERSFSGRLFDISYVFTATLFSIISALAVFYLFSDWVLLSVTIIFIFGIAWASKQTFPKIWYQIRMILNFGPVKEGEVIVYNGLSYKVISINLYTTLLNPSIQGGLIKIPISDIIELRSRPQIENEPWFPSEKGDWVVLDSDRHGKIITQTHESVKLELHGGAIISYLTKDFLNLSPMNLASGFRLWLEFGLDYKHQKDITSEIPEILKKGISDCLSTSGYSEYVAGINVHFKNAAQSSLNIGIIADFDGKAGEYYQLLDRIIHESCVEVCNKNDFTIPFMQMTLHMAENK